VAQVGETYALPSELIRFRDTVRQATLQRLVIARALL
jgi:hypothetical protein